MTFLFAWRYFRAKKTTNIINIIAWISVVAIAVGTASLIVVLSVFNGFEGLVKSMYGDFYADLKIIPQQGKILTISHEQIQQIQQHQQIKNFTTVIEEKAVLVKGEVQAIVAIKGVDSHYHKVANIEKYIEEGKDFSLGTKDFPSIILGGGIHHQLDPYNYIKAPMVIYMPNRNAQSFRHIQEAMHSFEINQTGVFSIQDEFDKKYAFTNIDFVRYMLDLPNDAYSYLELNIKNNASVASVQDFIYQVLGKQCKVQTRYEQNQSLFAIMQMEKWIIYIILSFILVIAAFNMIGALTMLVLEKKKDIAILKSLGANNQLIRRIFLSEGLLLATIGCTVGMLLSFIICYIQLTFKPLKLTGGSFLIDYYPVQIHAVDFLLVATTVFIIAMLASWIPAHKATQSFFSLKS